jgi:hypothetical protein
MEAWMLAATQSEQHGQATHVSPLMVWCGLLRIFVDMGPT